MLLALLFLGLGTLILALGAESAIRGATRFAVVAGIPAFAVGALLFGVDIEGLSAALLAAGRGQTSIAAGEAYGTVIFLFSAAFGAALLVSRRPVASPSTPMVLIPAIPLVAGALTLHDSHVNRAEGILLVLLYVAYVAAVVVEGRAVRQRAGQLEHEAEEVGGGRLRAALIAVAGLAAVYGGAWLLVDGGIRILDRSALTAGFVGAAIVGTLASLDEVLLEVLPVRRGTPELATGNLLGTVAAFTSVVPGLAALIRPLDVDPAASVAFLAAAALYALVAMTFLVRGRAGKLLGLVVLGSYAAWLLYAASL